MKSANLALKHKVKGWGEGGGGRALGWMASKRALRSGLQEREGGGGGGVRWRQRREVGGRKVPERWANL